MDATLTETLRLEAVQRPQEREVDELAICDSWSACKKEKPATAGGELRTSCPNDERSRGSKSQTQSGACRD